MEKSLTLTDLSEAAVRLLDMDMTMEELAPFMEGIKTQGKDKILSIVAVIRELEAQIVGINAEAQRLLERANTRDNRVSWLKSYLKANMESLDLDKVESPTATVWLQRNPASVEVTDETAVPKEWFRATIRTLLSEVPENLLNAVTRKDIEARPILELHKAGQPLPPGVRIVDDKRHLRIK